MQSLGGQDGEIPAPVPAIANHAVGPGIIVMGDEILPKELQGSLRRGKWTPEEEQYTSRIIHDFEHGLLNVPEGTTLRNYLSKTLNCDPMRITKKYTGDGCIGKRVFSPLPRTDKNIPDLDLAQGELRVLRRLWLERLLSFERESARRICLKAASKQSGRPRVTTMSIVEGMLTTPGAHFGGLSGSAGAGVGAGAGMGSGRGLGGRHPSPHSSNNDMSVGGEGPPSSSSSRSDFVSPILGFEGGTILPDDKMNLALRSFLSDEKEIEELISWLKRSNNALAFSSR